MEYGYTAWVSNFVQNRPFCVYDSISCTPEEIFYTYFIGGVGDKYEVCLYEVFEYSMKYEYSMKGTDNMVRSSMILVVKFMEISWENFTQKSS